MRNALALFAALLAGQPVPAAAQSLPTATDNTQIDALVKPMIDGLIGGKAKDAIVAFLNHSEMMRAKPMDASFLGTQAEAAIAAYGPIRGCDLTEQKSTSKLAASRLYICQHDRFLTRWIVVLFKSPSGWQPSNLRFDDKFLAKLDEQ